MNPADDGLPAEDGSVTRWLEDLKRGDLEVSQPLWERYFDKLVGHARSKLRDRRRAVVADEEDAALSAFDSFCASAAAGRFPKLNDRDDLWQLLIVITTRKAIDLLERQGRRKRGGGRVLGEADLDPDGLGLGLDHLAGPDPTPEFAALLAEQYQGMLDRLDDDTYRRVAVARLEGYTGQEIAASLGCSLRTVASKLQVIRLAWEREGAGA